MFQTTNQLWCWLKDIPLKGWLMESYPEPWSITKRIFPTSGIDPKSTGKKHVWLRIAMNKLMSTVICRYESTIIDSYLRVQARKISDLSISQLLKWFPLDRQSRRIQGGHSQRTTLIRMDGLVAAAGVTTKSPKKVGGCGRHLKVRRFEV